MNGYIEPITSNVGNIENNMSYSTTIYPGRLKGLMGDWGPRQEGYSGHLGYGQFNSYGGPLSGKDNLTATDVYPLDYQALNGFWAGVPYNNRRKAVGSVRYNRLEDRVY